MIDKDTQMTNIPSLLFFSRSGLGFLLLSFLLGFGVSGELGGVALAQETITGGQFIPEVSVNRDGVLVDAARNNNLGSSFRYREAAGGPLSCDIYSSPGQNLTIEGFSIEGEVAGTPFTARNQLGQAQVVRTTGPTATGNTEIRWEGNFNNPANPGSNVNLNITQIVRRPQNARYIQVRVFVENIGGTVSNFYYSRGGDPDPAACGDLGPQDPPTATINDVRTVPVSGALGSALVTSRTSTDTPFVMGLGAFNFPEYDYEPRGHVGLNANDNAGLEENFNSPRDPDGLIQEDANQVSMVYRIDEIPAGETVRFDLFYVFGTTEEEVQERLEELVCVLAPAGTDCDAVGGDFCIIGDACTGPTPNPDNVTDTNLPTGTGVCEDAQLPPAGSGVARDCSVGFDLCVSGAMCDEVNDQCTFDRIDGCAILDLGICLADGDLCPDPPFASGCFVCDAATSQTSCTFDSSIPGCENLMPPPGVGPGVDGGVGPDGGPTLADSGFEVRGCGGDCRAGGAPGVFAQWLLWAFAVLLVLRRRARTSCNLR